MRQQKLKMEILGESSATLSPCEGSHLSNGLVAHRHCQTIQTQVQQAGGSGTNQLSDPGESYTHLGPLFHSEKWG